MLPEVHQLFLEIYTHHDLLPTLKVPTHYLFPVHHSQPVVEAYCSCRVATILPDYVSTTAYSVTIRKVFLPDDILMADAHHDIAWNWIVYP